MRSKKHNPKIPIITGIILFFVISIAVINAQDMKTISRVKVSNQSIVISQGDTGISNQQVGFKNSGNLSNQDINGNNADLNIENNGSLNNAGGSFSNSGNFSNQDANFGNQGNFGNTGGSFGNSGNFNNQDANFGNQGNFGNTGGNFNNQGGGFNNQGWEGGDSGNNYGNYNVGFGNQDYSKDANRYKYQNIDWSTWKSNFVNRILDDSMYISSLDYYGLGTWFYYSFYVTDTGEIKDVNIFSLYLKNEDKKQIRQLIRSYAHQPITIFPKDSKRKKAKIKAIMLLGDTETKSNASNFRDIEKIKIQY